jgi:hypothetical protein
VEIDLVDKVTNFIYERAPYKDKEELRGRVQKHLEYKTGRVLISRDGVVGAVCLYNIMPGGQTVFVTELSISKEYTKLDFMRETLKAAMRIWPLKFIMADRENKDGTNRGRRVWSTERFLRRKA